MVVCGAACGDTKLRLAQLRDVARAGRKQHRLFDVVLVHDLEPHLDLLRRAHVAIVPGVAKRIEEIRIEGLIGRPEARVSAVPRRRQIFANVALAFQHMSISVYYRRPISHVPSSFNRSFDFTMPQRITTPGCVNRLVLLPCDC